MGSRRLLLACGGTVFEVPDADVNIVVCGPHGLCVELLYRLAVLAAKVPRPAGKPGGRLAVDTSRPPAGVDCRLDPGRRYTIELWEAPPYAIACAGVVCAADHTPEHAAWLAAASAHLLEELGMSRVLAALGSDMDTHLPHGAELEDEECARIVDLHGGEWGVARDVSTLARLVAVASPGTAIAAYIPVAVYHYSPIIRLALRGARKGARVYIATYDEGLVARIRELTRRAAAVHPATLVTVKVAREGPGDVHVSDEFTAVY